ncbi:MAG: FHA domain-containing protein [Anaerolineales bacterium]
MTGIVLLILRAGMALALYAFLGWALYILWQDLRQQQKATQEGQYSPEIWLKIEVDEETQTRRFRGTEITIGRDPTCECALPSETVSVRHARFSFHHAQWWIEDLKSTNGTYLNAESVRVPTVVTASDVIRCGAVTFTVLEESEVE